MARTRSGVSGPLEAVSSAVTRWTGSSAAFGGATSIVLLWALLGPAFHYSDTWQLVINTGTTIVTFLMVFLIQRSQNKDALAIHLKLNELVAAIEGASNRLIRRRSVVRERASGTAATLHRAGETGPRRPRRHAISFRRRSAEPALGEVEGPPADSEELKPGRRFEITVSRTDRTDASRTSRRDSACPEDGP